MEDIKDHQKIEISSEKSFAYTFGIIFLLITFFCVYKNSYDWKFFSSLSASIFFFLSGYLFPQILKKPNLIWARIGLVIGRFISPVVLGVIYIILIIPTGFFLKVMKKNYLGIKIDKSRETYWIIRNKGDLNSMRKQF